MEFEPKSSFPISRKAEAPRTHTRDVSACCKMSPSAGRVTTRATVITFVQASG